MGATPIICSPVPRQTWVEGKVARSGTDGYGAWARSVAQEENVAFVDLNSLIAGCYEQLGKEKVKTLFADENTHTSREGAELNATIVAKALRYLPADPLGAFGR